MVMISPKLTQVALRFLGAAALGLALASASVAQETPTTIDGVSTVTAEEVKALLGQGATLCDFRKKASYVEKHIPKATLCKYDEQSAKEASFNAAEDTFDLTQLPANKHAKIILHGHGPDGWKGYKAAVAALKAGYTQIYFFRGGFAEWVAKGLPTE
ncbi:MAG: rhodanese-like domain-containing protein [Candidatus Tectimicrobiota bacterium]